jgi:hypothetical protein
MFGFGVVSCTALHAGLKSGVAHAGELSQSDSEKSDREAPSTIRGAPPSFAQKALSSWSETTLKRQATLSLFVHEGVDTERQYFRPQREIRLAERGSLLGDAQSFHWDLKLHMNRDVASPDRDLDEDYGTRYTRLLNGSVLGQSSQFIVRGLYWQRSEETWMFQIGSMQHIWGPADGINTLSVMNPQDLRFGLLGDKDSKYLAIPSAKLSLNQSDTNLSLTYAPWAQASLLPEPIHNYNINLDNQNFKTVLQPRRSILLSPSAAVKLDKNIGGADVTALFYNGTDYDPIGIPTALEVKNNEPLELQVDQAQFRKTSFGLGYNQVVGPWALKAEGLYTPKKRVLPVVDIDQIQDEVLPTPPRTGQHIQTSIGFNYFTPIRNLLGISLGETVVTAEYFRQRIFGKSLLPAVLSDLILMNIRTAALDDQLEINISQALDLSLHGNTHALKATYLGSTLNHSFIYTALGGRKPEGNNIASIFYYWRRNDSIAYEISYNLK